MTTWECSRCGESTKCRSGVLVYMQALALRDRLGDNGHGRQRQGFYTSALCFDGEGAEHDVAYYFVFAPRHQRYAGVRSVSQIIDQPRLVLTAERQTVHLPDGGNVS
jgi:hypothetical protein